MFVFLRLHCRSHMHLRPTNWTTIAYTQPIFETLVVNVSITFASFGWIFFEMYRRSQCICFYILQTDETLRRIVVQNVHYYTITY
jgi:hypothetical protein